MSKGDVQVLPLGGHSNSYSTYAALKNLGLSVKWIHYGDSIEEDLPLILPGVGTFQGAMEFLKNSGFDRQILFHAGRLAPLIGICLGLQVLCSKGFEGDNGPLDGLNLLRGEVRPLGEESGPHLNIGWKKVYSSVSANREEQTYYFCHEYYVQPHEQTYETSRHKSTEISAALKHGNVVGYQFHPELSGQIGYERLKRDLGL